MGACCDTIDSACRLQLRPAIRMVMRSGSTYLFIGIVVVYLILAVACARTLMPWCDEAWFAGPAYNLMTHGYMGTPVLDPTSGWFIRDLTHIDRYTYWIMPLYPF